MEETDSWRDRLKLSSEDLTDPINLEGQSVKHDLELLTAPHFCQSENNGGNFLGENTFL